MKKTISILLVLAMLLVTLGACGKQTTPETTAAPETTQAAAETQATEQTEASETAAAADTKIVVDAYGNEVEIPSPL